MNGTHARHFVAATKNLNFAHAARSLNVPRSTVVASVKALEAELGYPLFDYSAPGTTMSDAGIALRDQSRHERTRSATAAEAAAPPPGGKAKASKGKGRAPAVKGAPRVGKRRQSR